MSLGLSRRAGSTFAHLKPDKICGHRPVGVDGLDDWLVDTIDVKQLLSSVSEASRLGAQGTDLWGSAAALCIPALHVTWCKAAAIQDSSTVCRQPAQLGPAQQAHSQPKRQSKWPGAYHTTTRRGRGACCRAAGSRTGPSCGSDW